MSYSQSTSRTKKFLATFTSAVMLISSTQAVFVLIFASLFGFIQSTYADFTQNDSDGFYQVDFNGNEQ